MSTKGDIIIGAQQDNSEFRSFSRGEHRGPSNWELTIISRWVLHPMAKDPELSHASLIHSRWPRMNRICLTGACALPFTSDSPRSNGFSRLLTLAARAVN